MMKTIICCVFIVCVSLATSQMVYPDQFSASINRPIRLEPEDNICGFSGGAGDTYCGSFADASFVDNCWELYCNLQCPGRTKLPSDVQAFEIAQNFAGEDPQSCVHKNYTERAPRLWDNGVSYSVQFKALGPGNNCRIVLKQVNLIPFITLSSDWSVTLVFWIKPQIKDISSTIFAISNTELDGVFRLFLDGNLTLGLDNGRTKYSHQNWTIPYGEWTHIAVQCYKGNISLHTNGDLVYPTLHNIPMRPTGWAQRFQIGKTLESEVNDFYEGFIEDFRIFSKSLTNREVLEVYQGQLPATRVLNKCRCPSSHPRMTEDNTIWCFQNEGIDVLNNGAPFDVNGEDYRLNKTSHPAEFVNDAAGTATSWISHPGQEHSSLVVELKEEYQVMEVDISFLSPLPEKLTIEKREMNSSDWGIWQQYSQHCMDNFGIPPNGQLHSALGVNCLHFFEVGASTPYTNGRVSFSILEGRPGVASSGAMSEPLRLFTKAGAVRINMTGHPFVINLKHKYHSISNINIRARCDCNGHGTGCDVTVVPYQCTCSPESNTKGRQCSECVEDAWRDQTKHIFEPGACKLCQCQEAGTVDATGSCAQNGGKCICKENVEGQECDRCKSGFYNLTSQNYKGCEPCSCDSGGIVMDQGCNNVTGQCRCKTNVEGVSCNSCKSGYYGLSQSLPDGCMSCDCDMDGTMPGSACDDNSGQCRCKANTRGRRCDQCSPGTYSLDADDVDGCKPCNCGDAATSDDCDSVTGQCTCRKNVINRTCETCLDGFYAVDENDFNVNGCTHPCGCNQAGSRPGLESTCSKIKGICACKSQVRGDKCDTCVDGTFGLNASSVQGCGLCVCDVRGSTRDDMICDKDTGQCACKKYAEGLSCDECMVDTYNLTSVNTDGCSSCTCYKPATPPGSTCNNITGLCSCIEGAGDPALTDFTCSPYVSGIFPKHGPESGGTLVTISGGFLGDTNSAIIHLGDLICDIIPTMSSHTSTVCETRSIFNTTNSNLTSKQLPVNMGFGESIALPLNDMFVYGPNPLIDDIYPLKTIFSGGLIMTITGKYFESAARPQLDIFLKRKEVISTFTSDCLIASDEMMKCPTPAIEMTENENEDDTKSSRGSSDTNDQSTKHSNTTRVRRDTTLSGGEDDEFDFYYGVRMDGYDRYANMSEARPDLANLRVYKNPEFERFTESDAIRMYRTYWPYLHKSVKIKGKRMDLAASSEMYTVMVGIEECLEIVLTTTEITCTPPDSQPEAKEHIASQKDVPPVTVFLGNLVVAVGYLKYETSFWDNSTYRNSVIGGGAAVLLLILALIICVCIRRGKKTEEEDEDKHHYLEMDTVKRNNEYISAFGGSLRNSTSGYVNPATDILFLLPEDLQFKVRQCILEPRRMEVGRIIGRGQFGVVYLGRLEDEFTGQPVSVAIKTLKEQNVTPREVTHFLDEATMMKDLKHEHVLSLLGVVIQNDRPYVLLPYMENGDLKTFISSEDNLLNVGDLVNFSVQIADGMAYLSGQKFIHRDLAARNCMVDKHLIVKIADFGLSRDIYETEYYREGDERRPLPVRWMAIESLGRGVYTSKSDVWSYGVLLWELMTRGCTPYPDVDSYDIKDYISNGLRMDKPDFAPPEIYEIMLECWDPIPERRPKFVEISMRLTRLLTSQTASTMMRQSRKNVVRPMSFHNASMRLDVLP